MDDDRLINYTSLERGGQLTAEISESGMYYIKIEGDGYTDYSFTVNFDESETDTPTDTETTTDAPTDTETTTDTPIDTTIEEETSPVSDNSDDSSIEDTDSNSDARDKEDC